MSQSSLKRIEKAIEKLNETQTELCAQLAGVEARLGALEHGGSDPAQEDRTLAFLDEFRAGEALGESSLGAWIAVCESECLRGGLRTVQMREGMHARLLAERIKELGGSPQHEIPAAIQDAVMAESGSPEKSDREKLEAFVARFPDPGKAVQPILDQADRLDADPETQSLLRTIAQDERATLEFLCEACGQLQGA